MPEITPTPEDLARDLSADLDHVEANKGFLPLSIFFRWRAALRRALAAEQEVARLCEPGSIRCTYCGFLASGQEEAREHISACEKHPYFALLGLKNRLEQECQELREQLKVAQSNHVEITGYRCDWCGHIYVGPDAEQQMNEHARVCEKNPFLAENKALRNRVHRLEAFIADCTLLGRKISQE